jgi:hypothetical protein
VIEINQNATGIPNYLELLGRLSVILWTAGCVAAENPALQGEYVIVPGDGSSWDSAAFSSNHPDACLIPDPTYFFALGFADFDTLVSTQAPAWEDRIAKVFWRGSTTGVKRYWPPEHDADYAWLPRLELCARARTSSLGRQLDIGISQLVQISPNTEKVEACVARLGLSAPAVPRLRFADFKAVVDIDGNSDSWARGLYCSLLTRSCVIKIESEQLFRSWYYDRLKAWEHYVPVRSDLSDFEDGVRWILEHDDQARQIGLAGYELAKSLEFLAEMDRSVDRLAKWMQARSRR